MDKATQQNAALVEESAAAAESLKVQAGQLVQTVAVFKLAHDAVPDAHPVVAPKPSIARSFAKPVARAAVPKPVPPVERRGPDRAKNVIRPKFDAAPPAAAAPAPAPQTGTDTWETF